MFLLIFASLRPEAVGLALSFLVVNTAMAILGIALVARIVHIGLFAARRGLFLTADDLVRVVALIVVAGFLVSFTLVLAWFLITSDATGNTSGSIGSGASALASAGAIIVGGLQAATKSREAVEIFVRDAEKSIKDAANRTEDQFGENADMHMS